MRLRRSPDPSLHHPLERVWCSIRSGLLLRWPELHITRLRSTHDPIDFLREFSDSAAIVGCLFGARRSAQQSHTFFRRAPKRHLPPYIRGYPSSGLCLWHIVPSVRTVAAEG